MEYINVCDGLIGRVIGGLVGAFFFFQAEDGIRDLVRSRGLGDVYKRQGLPKDRLTGMRVVRTIRGRSGRPGPETASAVSQLSLIHI